ncbi:MAG: magnesium transporter CorA family protein [Thermoplasmata archaeon]|nr:magnesium transporter CorA family protein [Thermoplasmata archaeon]
MLKLYCSESGILKECSQAKPQDALWIDAIAPSSDEVDLLNRLFKIQYPDVADCLDPNERSRVELDEDYDFVVLRSLLKKAHEMDPAQTMPIGIFVTPDRIITVRIVATFDGKDLLADVKRKPKINDKSDLFLSIVRRANKDIDRYVRPLEGKISLTQKAVFTQEKAELAEDAYTMNSDLILLNTSLLSNFNAVSQIPRTRHLKFSEEQVDFLEDIENDVAQMYDMTTVYREIMSNVLRAYESDIANNLSSIMKILTSISLILMLPTLIASLYGMNIALPFENDPYAFWIVISFTAIAVAILWILFRVKKIF